MVATPELTREASMTDQLGFHVTRVDTE